MAKKEIIVIDNLYASALSGMLFLICEKRLPVLLVAFLISFTSLGQNYYSGRVLGLDKEPIANAHIQVINTSIGTITNSNGYFSFNLAKFQISKNKQNKDTTHHTPHTAHHRRSRHRHRGQRPDAVGR